MTDRILDLSLQPAYLSCRNDLLIVNMENAPPMTVPLVDLAAVVISHPQVTFTQSVLAGLARLGSTMIVCDERHLPAAMLLPMEGHHIQARRFILQAQCPLPTRKRLWKQLVRAKVRAQTAMLKKLTGDDAGLSQLLPEIRTGDPANIEAHAARIYWPALFGVDFRRNFAAPDQNRLLNYGYAVLRAVVARALCAHGLHPSMSLHHHNQYDAFCLADDLIEPFRPIVDELVFQHVKLYGSTAELDKQAKQHLLEFTQNRYRWNGEERSIFEVLSKVSASLVSVLERQQKNLELPEL